MSELLTLPARPVDWNIKISSPFGLRKINGKEEFHKGIDFPVPVGTPVKAMVDGQVFRAGWEREPESSPDYKNIGFGLRVWQTFRFNEKDFYAWYGHLSQIFVKQGQSFKAGDIIGFSGETGRTYSASHAGPAPHLHVQAREVDTNNFYDLDWIKPGGIA